MIYNYNKLVAVDRLEQEIRDHAGITTALESVSALSTAVTIKFKAVLSYPEEASLTEVINNHIATPLPQNVIQRVLVSEIPPMAAKRLSTGERLFKRVHGIEIDAHAGQNIATWTTPYPWAKFIAIEFINAEIGDKCSLNVLDSVTGMISGYANANLNQFGFTVNLAERFYRHESQFDADLYYGLQIRLVLNSVSAKKVYVNFVMNEVKS